MSEDNMMVMGKEKAKAKAAAKTTREKVKATACKGAKSANAGKAETRAKGRKNSRGRNKDLDDLNEFNNYDNSNKGHQENPIFVGSWSSGHSAVTFAVPVVMEPSHPKPKPCKRAQTNQVEVVIEVPKQHVPNATNQQTCPTSQAPGGDRCPPPPPGSDHCPSPPPGSDFCPPPPPGGDYRLPPPAGMDSCLPPLLAVTVVCLHLLVGAIANIHLLGVVIIHHSMEMLFVLHSLSEVLFNSPLPLLLVLGSLPVVPIRESMHHPPLLFSQPPQTAVHQPPSGLLKAMERSKCTGRQEANVYDWVGHIYLVVESS
ncbi:hypothetical protein FA15DRAFT_741951 [Coprinopsis marcescibilis]|uniref:Uncharacterized protein n=1 Tax=Coprinopsis marcescibilis TaxID=230819 RepID=A0A5C3K9G4_COPMA|nr:hypothetical protein FA15DRAFT_741951 [Coprinopsis marcescibilis]